MCKFASSVITRDKEFYLPNSDSHTRIINHFGLNEYSPVTGAHIVKIEITPNPNVKVWPSLANWNYNIDQDVLPDWHTANPDDTRKRAFESLARRAKGGFKTVNLGAMNNLVTLALPKTTNLRITGAAKLETINTPQATHIAVHHVPKLKSITTSKAKELTINRAPKLLKVVAPNVKGYLDVSDNKGLQYVSAKQAKAVWVNGCRNLKKVYAPHATNVYIGGTPTNLVIKAKKGAYIDRCGKVTRAK